MSAKWCGLTVTVMLGLIVACSDNSHAAMTCDHATAKWEAFTGLDFNKWAGWQSVSTTEDKNIANLCTTRNWNNPVDVWRYGDYDFLFENRKERYPTKKDLDKPLGSFDQQYPKQIQRYVCKTGASVAGYFAYHIKREGNRDAEQRAVDTMKGADKRDNPPDNALKSLTIDALNSAIPFYSSFIGDCSTLTEGKVTKTVFSFNKEELSKAHLERKTRYFTENFNNGGRPTCRLIDYGCLRRDKYDELHELEQKLEEAGYENVLRPDCADEPDSMEVIEVDQVIKEMCDVAREGLGGTLLDICISKGKGE